MPDSMLFYVSHIALWILVGFQSLVLLELVRRLGSGGVSAKELEPTEGEELLGTGTPAPSFEAPILPNMQLMKSEAWYGRPLMLVFTTPKCSGCVEVADELIDMHLNSDRQLVVFCVGESSGCVTFAETYLPGVSVLLDEKGMMAKEFRVTRTPTVIMIDEDAQIARYGFPRSVTRLQLNELLGVKSDKSQPKPQQVEVRLG